jgi:hypothetical protein
MDEVSDSGFDEDGKEEFVDPYCDFESRRNTRQILTNRRRALAML